MSFLQANDCAANPDVNWTSCVTESWIRLGLCELYGIRKRLTNFQNPISKAVMFVFKINFSIISHFIHCKLVEEVIKSFKWAKDITMKMV
jgi:hypothetical protein